MTLSSFELCELTFMSSFWIIHATWFISAWPAHMSFKTASWPFTEHARNNETAAVNQGIIVWVKVLETRNQNKKWSFLSWGSSGGLNKRGNTVCFIFLTPSPLVIGPSTCVNKKNTHEGHKPPSSLRHEFDVNNVWSAFLYTLFKFETLIWVRLYCAVLWLDDQV